VCDGDRKVLVATVRGGGVAPILVENRELEFNAGDLCLFTRPLRSAVILGGAPLVPDEAQPAVLHAIADELPEIDAIEISLVPRALLRTLACPDITRRFLVYEPEVQGKGPVRTIDMPESFDAYLAKFNAKTRSTLRRRVRAMRELGMQVVRYERPGEGRAFLEAAAPVAKKTWQRKAGDRFEEGTAWPRRVEDLASHGLLRGYVLFVGGEPCAFVLGVQIGGAFHYAKPGFDERFAKLSPGTVLLYEILADFFAERAPTTVCFCTGDAGYKRFFANAETDTADLLLIRRRGSNGLLVAAHAGLRGGVALAKRWFRGA
jgi:CelD/BcsL family acetyltransferase involved in cellulose biosynthesis